MISFKDWLQEAATTPVNPTAMTKLAQGLSSVIQDRIEASAKAKEEEAKKKAPQAGTATQTTTTPTTPTKPGGIDPATQKALVDKISSLFK